MQVLNQLCILSLSFTGGLLCRHSTVFIMHEKGGETYEEYLMGHNRRFEHVK